MILPLAQGGSSSPYGQMPVDLNDMTIEALFSHLHSRAPENKMQPRTEPLKNLMDLLGQPQQSYPVIQITGTNGKTSTARMIESGLRASGLRTLRYTSPHLGSMLERISIDGIDVDPDTFMRIFEDIAPFLTMIDNDLIHKNKSPLTFFEVLTAMAYSLGADVPVDVMIAEVGLGGFYDATNIVNSSVAVFTPISYDHMDYLGSSLENIAREKSGIINSDSYVISAEQKPEVDQIIFSTAQNFNDQIAMEGQNFGVTSDQVAVGGQIISVQGLAGTYDDLMLPLHGKHQSQNAAVAIATLEAFIGGGKKALGQEVLDSMFQNISSPGRLEVVRTYPTVIVDATHNVAGAQVTAQTIDQTFSFEQIIMIFGALEDKDAQTMIEIFDTDLQNIVTWYFTQSDSPRAISPQELADSAERSGIDPDHVKVVSDLGQAIEEAIEQADSDINLESEPETAPAVGIVITGSVTIAGNARTILGATNYQGRTTLAYL